MTLSSGDEWFKRWGKMMPFGPWSYADVEEMMKEMEKEFMDFKDIDVPRELVRERRAKDGSVTRNIGPIVYGYSVTVGPDGKAVVREFGNVKRGSRAGWNDGPVDPREPLVDVVEGDRAVHIIAELPGVKKEDIELVVERDRLVISADTPAKKYRKELELPSSVEVDRSRSTFNNGILEMTFPKRSGKSSGVPDGID